MKKVAIVSFFILLLFSFSSFSNAGEEVIMEEPASPQQVTASTTNTRQTSSSSSYTTKSTAPVTNSTKPEEEEIFEEGNGQEQPKPTKPTNPQEKEMQQIPPSTTLEQEFEEEQSGGVVVTDQELQQLEEKINQLRNQILDTKSKIMELGDRISQGFISGTKLKLVFTNGMGGTFVPVKVVVKLDGYPIYQASNVKKLANADKMEIFAASILPENHRLDVDLIVRGKGYGIFTYMESVKLEVSATYYFSAPRGKTLTINIIPADKGSIYQLKDRPTIKFEIVE